MTVVAELPVLEKQPWEEDLFDAVYHERSFRDDEVIESVESVTYTAYGAGSITISGETHDGDRTVQFDIAGGTAGAVYKITVRVITNYGKKEMEVLLRIVDY